jgi:hypothetical protein
VEAPFFPICRSQVDARVECDSQKLAEQMRGFHWMMVYGDYLREAGYALKRTAIGWQCLG